MRFVIAVIIFSVVILIHELGHFLLAKKNHIEVLEFSLGMGPRILSTVKGGTRYSLKLLPLGGSCAMAGEDAEDDGPGTFNSASVWGRIAVVALPVSCCIPKAEPPDPEEAFFRRNPYVFLR